MCPISPISPMSPSSCAGHPLADSAVADEVLFEAADLLVEEVVGLVEEADGDVRHDVEGAGFGELAEILKGDPGAATETPHIQGLVGIRSPEGLVVDAELILIVLKEFPETGPRDFG